MGLFSRRIDRVQTEEERYRAEVEARAVEADRKARYDAVNQRASKKAQERREAWQQKQNQVKVVGEIRKVGRGRYVTAGWEIGVPDGSGRGRVTESEVIHTGTLAGFTPAELCRIAHGAGCRRCR
ncbi:hypothetical protein ACH5AG_08470 [Streptomyces anulatus]